MAAAGYPESPVTGAEITGLGGVESESIQVFHAGTRRDEKGVLRAAGGRVLGVVARDASLEEAARRAYAVVEKIRWDGEQHRRDVGTWGRS
jgi:phosphoribosylamine--glycine ligase